MSKQHQLRSRRGICSLPCADTLGMFASAVCLVHCSLIPLAVMALPAVAPKFVHDDRTHYFLAFFVVAFCLLAVLPGYLRHSQRRILWMMSAGISLVLFATFAAGGSIGPGWEVPLISAGNLLVIAAHYGNRKLLSCNH